MKKFLVLILCLVATSAFAFDFVPYAWKNYSSNSANITIPLYSGKAVAFRTLSTATNSGLRTATIRLNGTGATRPVTQTEQTLLLAPTVTSIVFGVTAGTPKTIIQVQFM